MKNKLGLLALVVALSAGPAWAADEFCDDQGGGPIDPGDGSDSGNDPGTGSCEVNLAYTVSMAHSRFTEERGRIRETGFNDAMLQKLRNESNELQIDWNIYNFNLGADTSQASEARIVEWSFRPTNKRGVERTLVISLRRKEGEIALMVDWLQAPRTDWSYATVSAAEPLWIDHRSVVLSPGVDGQPLYLKWVPGAVVVGVWTGKQLQELRFALPSNTWTPVRLRNAVMHGVATQDGTTVNISWPDQFQRYWSVPVLAPTGPGDEPVPLDPPLPQSQY